MGRRSNYSSICQLFEKLRADIPDISIRTTFMVGFPGETQQQFDRLCDFILQYKPNHIGVFAYSKEEGTPSYKLKGHIPKKEKLRRVDIIGEIAFSCAKEKNAALVGKVVDVIYEDIDCDKERFIGRTLLDAPEIDSLVFFTGSFADVGNMYKVKNTGYEDYDFIGEMVE